MLYLLLLLTHRHTHNNINNDNNDNHHDHDNHDNHDLDLYASNDHHPSLTSKWQWNGSSSRVKTGERSRHETRRDASLGMFFLLFIFSLTDIFILLDLHHYLLKKKSRGLVQRRTTTTITTYGPRTKKAQTTVQPSFGPYKLLGVKWEARDYTSRAYRFVFFLSFCLFFTTLLTDTTELFSITITTTTTTTPARHGSRTAAAVVTAAGREIGRDAGFKTRRVLNPRPKRRCKPSFGPLVCFLLINISFF